MQAVAPIFLGGVEGSLRAAIESETDPGRKAALEAALAIIEMIRGAQAAADVAERKAAEAQAFGDDEAARAEQQKAVANRQRAQFGVLQLRSKMVRLGMARPPLPTAVEGAP